MPWSRCVSNIFEFVLLQTKFGHLRQPGHLTLWKKLAEKHLVSPKSYENPHIAGRYKISQSSCFSWQSVNEFLSFFWGFHDEVWDLFFLLEGFCWQNHGQRWCLLSCSFGCPPRWIWDGKKLQVMRVLFLQLVDQRYLAPVNMVEISRFYALFRKKAYIIHISTTSMCTV